MQRWHLSLLLPCTLIAAAAPVVAYAQSTQGSLIGTIHDASGAVVAGAAVTAKRRYQFLAKGKQHHEPCANAGREVRSFGQGGKAGWDLIWRDLDRSALIYAEPRERFSRRGGAASLTAVPRKAFCNRRRTGSGARSPSARQHPAPQAARRPCEQCSCQRCAARVEPRSAAGCAGKRQG